MKGQMEDCILINEATCQVEDCKVAWDFEV